MKEIDKEEKLKLLEFVNKYKSLYIDIEQVTNKLEEINREKDILLNDLIETRNRENEFTEELKKKYNITENDIKNMFN
jgi:predicted nuclease with TOPRIM domain